MYFKHQCNFWLIYIKVIVRSKKVCCLSGGGYPNVCYLWKMHIWLLRAKTPLLPVIRNISCGSAMQFWRANIAAGKSVIHHLEGLRCL